MPAPSTGLNVRFTIFRAKESAMSDSSVLPSHGSYLLPRFEHATVADAMHPGILSCDAEEALAEVARMMSTHHVHCIVVGVRPEGGTDRPRAWGIISDLDLLRAGMRPNAAATAADLVTGPAASVDTTAPLRDAAELMLTQGTSHLVVVDPETRRPVGILSTLDIAGVLAWGEM
jgi:CBS domain-containing protein